VSSVPSVDQLTSCLVADLEFTAHHVVLVSSVVVVVVVVVEIFIHGTVKATVTNAPQSQLNK